MATVTSSKSVSINVDNTKASNTLLPNAKLPNAMLPNDNLNFKLEDGTNSQSQPQPHHPIVEDRVIEGDGTSIDTWQHWNGLRDLPSLDVENRFSVSQLSHPSTLPRVCIFAPHPDDEILGCAGLLQQLASNANPILIVYVTNGSQSHPESTIYPPHKLERIRPAESQTALKALKIADRVTTVSLNLTDGDVYNQQALFNQKIADIIQPNDIVVTPFVHDGHPDHEATGRVVYNYAKRHELDCYQVLIWAWHWGKPADERIPWHNAVRLDLTTEQLQRKTNAIHSFKSQITVDESTGNPPILSEHTIARISQPWEVYIYE